MVKNRLLKVAYLGLALGLSVSLGCTKKTEPRDLAQALQKSEVNLAIWGNYINQASVTRFTSETGIKVNITNYSSNEELLAKIQSGSSGIDVAVPSDYMVDIMAKQNLLAPLDTGKLTHFKKVQKELVGQSFDPENKFSVPYAWATAGIAYNKDLLPSGLHDWKSFLNDQALDGKISVLDDVREAMAVALKLGGKSVNTTNKGDIQMAKEILIKAKSRIKMFRSDTIDALINKEVVAAHTYSTDANQAALKTNGKIVYVLPKEGSTRSIDNLVVLKTSKSQEAAFKLIDFLTSPDVNVEFVSQVLAGPIFSETKSRLPENLKTNGGLFPEESVLKKLERIQDLGEITTEYDKAWTQIKAE